MRPLERRPLRPAAGASARPAAVAASKRSGGYAQAAYRVGDWEPVFRFSLVSPNDAEPDERLYQYGVGLNYWRSPSIAVMAAFELNRDKFDSGRDRPNNRFLIHWSFGF